MDKWLIGFVVTLAAFMLSMIGWAVHDEITLTHYETITVTAIGVESANSLGATEHVLADTRHHTYRFHDDSWLWMKPGHTYRVLIGGLNGTISDAVEVKQ